MILDGEIFETGRLSETVTSAKGEDIDAWYYGNKLGIHVPFKNPGGNQRPDPGTRTRNTLLRGLRSQGEREFALLSQRWTALQRITASPRRTTQIVRAALVLTQYEHKYLN